MKQAFEKWFAECHLVMMQVCGLTCDDLPDRNWYDAWESGSTPKEAVADYWEEYTD